MYKVLIVDDEPFILEGLRHIIDWQEHELEIVGEASYGIEALQIIESTNIHILITDVKMPFMNGLELIKNIRNRNLNIKCIVLSGYDDFEYVKEAAKLGIENYILKPVSEVELLSTIQNTIEKIESELHRQIEIRESMSILKENILYRWVTNNIDNDELQKKAEFLGIDLKSTGYIVAVIKILNGQEKESNYKSTSKIDDRNLLSYAAGNIINQTIEEYLPATAFHELDGDIVIIFTCKLIDFKNSLVPEILEKCINNVNLNLDAHLFITVGNSVNGYSSVHESYFNAKKLQEYCCANTHNQIIHFSDMLDEHASGNIVKKVQNYIHANYSKEMNLKIISSEFNISPGYLGQLFKKETGDTFPNYLNRIRIERAKKMLINTNLKASEISEKIGYGNNTNYFYTIFRKFTGVSPSEFNEDLNKL